MTDEWSAERWEAAIRSVFRRALADAEFRRLALSDPRAAFAVANGVAAPGNISFRFVDTLEEHVLVLPKVAVTQGSLSEIDIARILHHSMRQQSVPPAFSPEISHS
jgi:hypothetical protein